MSRFSSRRAGLAACFILAAAAPGLAQSSEVETLRRQLDQLRLDHGATKQELADLKARLKPVLDRLPQPFSPQQVSVEGSPVRGNPQAKVTLVEFSDRQCPFCVRHYRQTFPDLVKNYIDTGKVRYVAREFPLTNLHKEAERASQAALCAGRQDKYWEMRELIFENPEKLTDDDLASYAQAVGADPEPWKACMKSDVYARKVATDLKDGGRLGINGTPAFAVGLTDPDDPNTFRATKLIEGAYPYEAFQEAIDELLKGDSE